MTTTFDVAIAGLGVMGSASAHCLADRKQRVIAFDRFDPPHDRGSSHGESRIIREAYFEHPVYVPMVQRAYELWSELERHSGTLLYTRTGGVMIGAPQSAMVTGALRSAREHGLAHEVLAAPELRARFPAFVVPDGMIGVLEPRAGVLFAERCLRAQLDLAQAAGAEVHANEPVLRWEPRGDSVRVFTAGGTHDARWLVVCAGAWLDTLFPDLDLPLVVERQTLYWFDPATPSDAFDPRHCPIHLWQFDDGQFFYGFPNLGNGVKVARHHRGISVAIDHVEREVSPHEVTDIRSLVRRFVPGAEGTLRKSAVCLYTNTRDEHFWIDAHPAHPHVLIVSPCSGHGFKFAPVIGEIVADWVAERPLRFDLSLFKSRLS